MTIHLLINGIAAGPFSEATLDGMAEDGAINDDTLAWVPGMTDWLPLRQIRDRVGVEPAAPEGQDEALSEDALTLAETSPGPRTSSIDHVARKRHSRIERWLWVASGPLVGAIVAGLAHRDYPDLSSQLLWIIFGAGCCWGLAVAWWECRKTVAKPGRSTNPAEDVTRTASAQLDEILTKEGGMVDGGINGCIFHVFCVGMALGLSWILWMFGTAFLSTSDLLWGADHAGSHPEAHPEVGILRLAVHNLTGFEAPWFCCFLVGVAVTFVVGLVRAPFGFLDAILDGHTDESKKVILVYKTLGSALHLASFGGSTIVTALEDLLGGVGVGGTSVILGLTGWPYLQRFANIYQTPVRYVLNLVYGGAIFTLVFSIASHAVVGSIQNVMNHEWGWLLWTGFLGYAIALPFGWYCRAAWHQGFGIGLWLGSWIPPRGWQLRRIYRVPASVCLFHHDVVKDAMGLTYE